MKSGLRQKVLVVLLLIIPTAAWWFVFHPNTARNAELIRQINVQQAKLRALQHATVTIGDLKKEIDALTKTIGLFHSRLPQQKEMDKVLREVWELAESNHLVTKSIRPLERSEDRGFSSVASPYAEQPIAVHIEGDFLGFYAFLLALESQPRITRIREMRLDQLKKAQSGHIQANFVVSIFFEQGGSENRHPSEM